MTNPNEPNHQNDDGPILFLGDEVDVRYISGTSTTPIQGYYSGLTGFRI